MAPAAVSAAAAATATTPTVICRLCTPQGSYSHGPPSSAHHGRTRGRLAAAGPNKCTTSKAARSPPVPTAPFTRALTVRSHSASKSASSAAYLRAAAGTAPVTMGSTRCRTALSWMRAHRAVCTSPGVPPITTRTSSWVSPCHGDPARARVRAVVIVASPWHPTLLWPFHTHRNTSARSPFMGGRRARVRAGRAAHLCLPQS